MNFRFLPSALSLVVFASAASADVITQWTFETSLPLLADSSTITGLAAEVGTGVASGFHAGVATDWSNPVGNGSLESFSSNTWAIGDYYQFKTGTLGFTGIVVSWDQTRSGTGPGDFKLSYSVNGTDFTDVDGATWTTVISTGTNIVFSDLTTGGSWVSNKVATNTSLVFNLTSIPSLNNAPDVYFRLIATSAPSGAAGTNRVDNFTVSGTAVPEPSTFATLAGLVAVGAVAARRRRLR